MSRDRLELMSAVNSAFNRRDLDAFLSFLHPDVEHVPLAMEGPHRGHDGVRFWWEGLVSGLGDFNAEIQAMHEDGDIVLATLRFRGHGTDSGAPFDQMVWTVTQWRDEKVCWWSTHTSEAEAVEAVGLRG